MTIINMLDKMAREGGCIISSADATEIEIADARYWDNLWVDKSGYGFILRPPEWLAAHDPHCRMAQSGCNKVEIKLSFRKKQMPNIEEKMLEEEAALSSKKEQMPNIEEKMLEEASMPEWWRCLRDTILAFGVAAERLNSSSKGD